MQKTVYFEKLTPYSYESTKNGSVSEFILDLSELFERIVNNPHKSTLQTVLDEKYRFHVCKYHANDQIWELQILHLRDAVLPGIADEKTVYRRVTLADGEYVAESCTLLYDVPSGELYLQRNKMCMSASKLAFYLKCLLPSETPLLLKPCFSSKNNNYLTSDARIKKVILCCLSDQVNNTKPGTHLGPLLRHFSRYHGHMITIEIGRGRKSGTLAPDDANALVREAYEDSDVQKLKVQIAKGADSEFEWIDLLENREQLKCVIKYDKDNPITHEKLFDACRKAFQRNAE